MQEHRIPEHQAHPRGVVSRFHGDQDGAVLLFSLAGVLILMLVSWAVMDSGRAARAKMEVQASADVAAFSQASVKSRAMNMIAYTNVAKRSIVGIHSLYPAMFAAYEHWITEKYEICAANPTTECVQEVNENIDLFRREATNDWQRFGQNTTRYHARDIRALDNYQTYMLGLAPWWGWTEAVVRAQRNTATMASSHPAPGGPMRSTLPNITTQVVNRAGPGTGINFTSESDRLPVTRGDYWVDLFYDGMLEHQVFIDEHSDNARHHQNRSSLGAANPAVIQRGATVLFATGFAYSVSAFGRHGEPMRLEHVPNDARWLTRTSNVVFVYQEGPGYFDEMRGKFSFPEQDYELADQESYQPAGYWAISRSEISFQGDQRPDLWSPSWTARLRPVSLPDEFRDAGDDFNSLYRDSIFYLALSARIGSNNASNGSEYLDELVYMEKVSRALGQSTIGGLAK